MHGRQVGNQAGMFPTNKSADFDLFTYRDGLTAIPAVATNQQSGTTIMSSTVKGSVLGNLHDGAWALYGSVDLGSGGVSSTSLKIEAASLGGGSRHSSGKSSTTSTKRRRKDPEGHGHLGAPRTSRAFAAFLDMSQTPPPPDRGPALAAPLEPLTATSAIPGRFSHLGKPASIRLRAGGWNGCGCNAIPERSSNSAIMRTG
jgi:hypothetical protein